MAQRFRSGETVLILSALAIAYFIWLIAKMRNFEEVRLDGVSVYVSVPSHIEADPSLDAVSILVRYPKGQRREINSDAFHVLISDPDLATRAGVRAAESVTVPLLPSYIQHPTLPSSIQVERVEPPRLTVQVKFRITPVIVEPQVLGQLPSGYRVEQILLQRDWLLTGPQDILDNLPRNNQASVQLPTTPPIPLANLRESTKTVVAIVVPKGTNLLLEEPRPRALQDVTFIPVQVIIKEEDTTRTVESVPIYVPTLARNLIPRTEPTSGAVTLVGPRSRIENFAPKTLQLRPKNPPEENPDFVGTIAIEAYSEQPLPPDLRVVATRPETILLRYETRPSETRTTPTVSP